jgi:hypothetical protein
MEVVQRRRVVDLDDVGPRRQRAAIEVVPMWVAERDLATALVLDHAEQRSAARRADVRRWRRCRGDQAVDGPAAGARVHTRARVLAPRVERADALAGVRVALRVRNLELDVPQRRCAVVAVDVAAEDRWQRGIANHVAACDRAAGVAAA